MLTIVQRCATVDIDMNLILDPVTNGVRTNVIQHLDLIAGYTGTDIFLLSPKMKDTDSIGASFTSAFMDGSLDQRFRVSIYGDMESAEHAKTRVLIMIDQIVSQVRKQCWTHTY